MMRAKGEVRGGVVWVGGREVARVTPAVTVGEIAVSAGLPMVVRAMGARSERPAWMASEAGVFDEAVERLGEAARGRGVEVWWRPTREDVLSDVPSTLSFFRKHAGFGLVLDPGAMLTAEMMLRVEEHVERVLEVLGGHEALRLVVVRGGKVGEVVERLMEGLVASDVAVVRVGDSEGVGLQ